MQEPRLRPLQMVLATVLTGVIAALAIPSSQVRAITAPLWTKAYYETQVANTTTYYNQGCALGVQALNNQIPQDALTKRWGDGYAISYQWPMYNFGSADGCPSSGTQTATARPCNNGWTQEGVRYVSYGLLPALAVPEIYATSGVNASQWYYISKYSKLHYGTRITFSGELTQSGACAQRGGCTGTNNTPSQGYTQLYNKINSDADTSSAIKWSVDIKWDS